MPRFTDAWRRLLESGACSHADIPLRLDTPTTRNLVELSGEASAMRVVASTTVTEPSSVAFPLLNPVWPDGGVLYVDNAFDPRGLDDAVMRVTSTPFVAAQHAYKAIGGATGSYNFGVVSIMGIPGMFVQSHNKNALRAQELRAELRGRIWNQIRPKLDTLVPGWSIWLETYRKQCSDIPPLTAVSEALPWNGEQFNVCHGATRHKDRTDAKGLPCLITYCGTRGGTVRVHGQASAIDVSTKPGGLLLFDSTFEHEVLSSENAPTAIDGKGHYAPGRISCVWMANRQRHEYKSAEWVQENYNKLREEKQAEGIETTRKRRTP